MESTNESNSLTNKELSDKLGSISKEPSGYKDLVKNRQKNKKIALKAGLFVLFLVGLGALIFGLTVYGAFNKISDGSGGSSPVLKFFGNDIKPSSLKGEGDGRINIMFLGIGGENHNGGQLADTIMIASIDPVNKQLAMLSIPRDLRVPLKEGGFTKINAIHAYGEQNQEGSGPQALKDLLSEILDLPIHYYLKVDFDGFRKIVDEIGGIDINVPNEIYDPSYPAPNMIDYEPFYIKAGDQHLNGDVALKYARTRKSSSDFDRAERQQQIILAVREKAVSVGVLANPSKVLSIANILGDHVRMDMSAKEVSAFLSILSQLDASKTISKVLDNAADGPLYTYNVGGYYLVPKSGDWTEIQRIAHEIFKDPYLAKENAKIEIYNGTGVAGEARKLRDELLGLGYNVGEIKTSEEAQETVIKDYSDGKAEFTVDFLTKRLSSSSVKSTKDSSVPEDIKIQIILGKDYLEND